MISLLRHDRIKAGSVQFERDECANSLRRADVLAPIANLSRQWLQITPYRSKRPAVFPSAGYARGMLLEASPGCEFGARPIRFLDMPGEVNYQ